MSFIKVYLDSGANFKFLKKFHSKCEFIQFPYDSPDRPKKQKIQLAAPSALQWRDAHATWDEMNFTWSEMDESDQFEDIATIIGKSNRKDILHVDSAYNSKCHLFLTSDKKDIWTKRKKLEEICGFKIFCTSDEQHEIIKFIESFQAFQG